MKTRGLLVGRFQPCHLGHLKTIKQILEEVDELIIVIAAAQISFTIKNPLTAGERLVLLRKMLDNANVEITCYWLIPAQDIMDNMLWVHHIKRLIPRFDYYYGNNPFTTMLFENAGVKTKNTQIFERDKFEATLIREKIIKGEDITEFVDKDVSVLLNKWRIDERLKAITKMDSSNRIIDQRGSELGKNS